MHQSVFVLGVGMTPVAEHWGTSLRVLALEAMRAAIADAGGVQPQALYVANALAPILSGQTHRGALLADFAGLDGIEASTVEAAGAWGGVAIRQAWLALEAGAVETVMVVGVEKVTDRVGTGLDAALSAWSDADYEAVHGLTATSQAALVMRPYLDYHPPPPAPRVPGGPEVQVRGPASAAGRLAIHDQPDPLRLPAAAASAERALQAAGL